MEPQIAKLTRPRFTGVVERRRLLDQLDRISKTKIAWISAPAGSGKTTLVANWLDSRKLRCIWYQADAGDADIATFFSYMGRAIKHAAPKYRKRPRLFTPEYSLGIPTFTKQFFETLYTRLVSTHSLRRTSDRSNRNQTSHGYAIVIDNYQEVPVETLFHEVVRDGLSVAPDGIMIVIASRSDPPPAFSKLQASNRLEILRKDEVGFTFEESRELVVLRGEKRPVDDVFKALYRMTEGWAAGLVLLTESAVTRDDLPELWEVPLDCIFDYFAVELFCRTDDETRNFLMMTAFLPMMTARNAEGLTGNKRSDHILSLLSRHNFFTQRSATPEIVYQYHPLFRKFLLNEARVRIADDEIVRIKKKAAMLIEAEGQTEDAAKLLIEAEDWQDLSDIVRRHAPGFMSTGRFHTIEAWIGRMPPLVVEQHGWLLYWKASCCITAKPAEARSMFKKAYALALNAHDATGSYLSWTGIVNTFMYEWRDFHPLDRWIAAFAELWREYGGFPSPEIDERATSAIFTAMMFRQPEHPDLPVWTKRAQLVIQNTADSSRRMITGNSLILYYLWSGRISEAGELVSLLLPIIKSVHGAPFPKLMWYRSVALYDFYVSQTESGLEAVEQGLRLAGETGIHHMDLMFYGVAIYHATVLGDLELARKYLERLASERDRGGCYADIYYTSQSALIALLRGDLDTAVVQAEESVRLTHEAGVPLILNANQAALAFVLMEARQDDKLALQIAELRNRAAVTKSVHTEAWCSCIEAQLALRDGNDALFTDRFSKAVDVCKKTGLRCLTFLPTTLAGLCAGALELNIETDFVKELITLNRLVPEDPGAAPDSWPYPLKAYTLGRFELLVDDKLVTFSGRVQQKPLALLKVLIAFGGKGVREEKITDALWPDADGDVAHQSFETTLHRLRKMINNDKAIVLREGQVSLDARYCWVDTRAFERILCKSEEAWKREGNGHEDDENPVRLTEKAVSLYKGHFLPAESKQPWTISLRERLRAKFMFCVSRLGEHWMENGRYDKAVRVFVNALEIDDLAEEFYQHLMVCYHQLGQQTEAIKAYHRCRKVLQSSLGLKPSSKTEGIYYAIRQEK